MSNTLEFLSETHIVGMENVDIEELVLATFINFPDTYYHYAQQISVNEFSTTQTRYIFIAIKELSEGSKIDLGTVTNKIKENKFDRIVEQKMNGFSIGVYLDGIIDRCQSDDHLKEHVKILNSYARRRKLLFLSEKIKKECSDMVDPIEVLSLINTEVVEIQALGEVEEFDVKRCLAETISEIENTDTSHLIRSYLNNLDNFIWGWSPGEFIVLAAATSMGKTAFALEVFKNNFCQGVPSMFFSLEMRDVLLTTRMLATQSCVDLDSIRRKRMSEQDRSDMHKTVGLFEDKPFWIDYKSRGLNRICNQIRKHVIRHGVKLVIIDYLQLMEYEGNAGNREQEISKITRGLKEIAVELEVVIIALSQINRSNKQRNNKRPILSDLRESGSIEQDADTVIFVYRPMYYNIEDKRPDVEKSELIIAKGRNCGVGNVDVTFISKIAKFVNSIDENPKLQAYKNSKEDSAEDWLSS